MFFEFGSLLFGLLTGLGTGWVFERRATRAAEAQNVELRRQLSVLRVTVLSLGGQPDPPAAPVRDHALAERVAIRAREAQDPSGRVARRALTAYFVQRGEDAAAITAGVEQLCAEGVLAEDGTWLRIR